ncbi:PKAR, partial [Symbiodinium necroappetens]
MGVARRLQLVRYLPGDVIIRQGEEEASEFFIVDHGEGFGERALLRDEPRAATVLADEEAAVFRLHRDDFVAVIRDRDHKEELIRGAKLFETMTDEQVHQLSSLLKMKTFKAGSDIIKQGDPGAEFFILDSGECVAVVTSGKSSQEVMRYSAGDLFGEKALLESAPRGATISAETDVVTYTLTREDFEAKMGPMSQLKADGKATVILRAHCDWVHADKDWAQLQSNPDRAFRRLLALSRTPGDGPQCAGRVVLMPRLKAWCILKKTKAASGSKHNGLRFFLANVSKDQALDIPELAVDWFDRRDQETRPTYAERCSQCYSRCPLGLPEATSNWASDERPQPLTKIAPKQLSAGGESLEFRVTGAVTTFANSFLIGALIVSTLMGVCRGNGKQSLSSPRDRLNPLVWDLVDRLLPPVLFPLSPATTDVADSPQLSDSEDMSVDGGGSGQRPGGQSKISGPATEAGTVCSMPSGTRLLRKEGRIVIIALASGKAMLLALEVNGVPREADNITVFNAKASGAPLALFFQQRHYEALVGKLTPWTCFLRWWPFSPRWLHQLFRTAFLVVLEPNLRPPLPSANMPDSPIDVDPDDEIGHFAVFKFELGHYEVVSMDQKTIASSLHLSSFDEKSVANRAPSVGSLLALTRTTVSPLQLLLSVLCSGTPSTRLRKGAGLPGKSRMKLELFRVLADGVWSPQQPSELLVTRSVPRSIARIRELNKGVARRVKDDVVFEKAWDSFRWPYLGFKKRTKRTTLCVKTAWRRKACGHCTRFKRHRRSHEKRCGSSAVNLASHRRKLLEIKKEAAKLDHGLDRQTFADVFNNAVVKLDAIATFMKSFVADIYCLQEVGVNKASGVDDEVFRTSVLSSCPGYLVQLDVASSRYTAVVFEFQFEASIKEIVVVSVYSYFSDKEATAALIEAIISSLRAIAMDSIIVGDMNVTADEPLMASRMSTGMARLLGEPFKSEELPGTAGGRRRIDYGIWSDGIFPSGLDHRQGIADHLSVRYLFGFTVAARDLELLEGHYGWLEQVPQCGMEGFAQLVLDKTEEEAKQVREAGFERWRSSLKDSTAKQSAWIKRRASMRSGHLCPRVTEVSKLSHTAVHPAEIIRQEVDSLLRRLPEIPSVEVEVSFSAAKLLKAVGKMKGTSDNWEVCHFQALPAGFWEALASLWQVVHSTSCVPRRWREARACLVPKAAGGHRPISVLCIAYRLGASVLPRELRRWTEQWLGARIMGGFHGRSTRDVFLRILHAAEDRLAMFVGEDVSKFFDSLSGPHVLRVLEHLKAPTALVGFVGSIMKEQRRVFSSGGRLGAEWTSPRKVQRKVTRSRLFSP